MERATMAAVVAKYQSQRGTKLAGKTIRTNASTLNHFADWWDESHKAPKNLTAGDLEDFLYDPRLLRMDWRKKAAYREVSDASFNKKLSDLRLFLTWSLARKAITDLDVLGALTEAERNPDEADYVRLSHTKITDAVESRKDPWERWVTAFAFYSFGREGEIVNTRLSDVDLSERMIKWPRPKVKKRNQQLPMLKQLRVEYERWRETYIRLCPEVERTERAGEFYVIPQRRNVGTGEGFWRYDPHVHPGRIGHIIKEAAAHALAISPDLLKGQATHIARRSGARAFYDALVEAGVEDPIRVVMAALGHTRQATTERYIGIEADQERLKRIMRDGDFLSIPDSNVIGLVRSS